MNFENHQSPSEVRNANNYKMDRFSENIILYGIAVGGFIFLDFFTDHWAFSLSIFMSSILFYVIETKITEPIDDIIYTSKYLESKPKCLIFWGLSALGLSVIFMAVYAVFSFPNHPFLYHYIKSVTLSGSIFFLSGFLRAFLVVTSLVSYNMIRRGYFAIFQAIFLLIRCILLTGIWRHFMIKENLRIIPIAFYMVVKAGLVFMILKQIWTDVKLYKINKDRLFKPAPPNHEFQYSYCPICLSEFVEPIVLPCRHVSCYECIHNWAKAKRTDLFCPMCREPFQAPVDIEMDNGNIPLSLYFVTF